jgi:hypothetical protein
MFATIMNNLPRNMKMAAIPFVKPNLNAFLIIRQNAFHADLQKFLLASATYKFETNINFYLDVSILSDELNESL